MQKILIRIFFVKHFLLFYYTVFQHEKRKKEPILSIFKFYLR